MLKRVIIASLMALIFSSPVVAGGLKVEDITISRIAKSKPEGVLLFIKEYRTYIIA